MTVRSLSQQEQSALTLLRNAFAQGKTDDECIDYAAAAMGEDMRPMIKRVYARTFKPHMGAG